MSAVINFKEKFDQISEYWSPKIIAELNGQLVKAAKIKGAFIWHHHKNEDELFQVLKGELIMQFIDREERLGPGEMIVIPSGIEHRPVAEEEVWILLFEPATTLNTGNIESEHTLRNLHSL